MNNHPHSWRRVGYSLLCVAWLVLVGCDTGPKKRKDLVRLPEPGAKGAAPAAKANPAAPAAKTDPAAPAAKTAPPAPATTPPAAEKTAAPAPGAPPTPPAAAPVAATTPSPAAAAKTAVPVPGEAPAEGAPAEGTAAPPAVATAAAMPTLPAASSINVEPVSPDWTPEKKMEQTVLRMRKIVYAMNEYAKKEGRFPPYAMINKENNQPMLSWRVLLLPYLGHQSLFEKFRPKQNWQAPSNKKLLVDIPPVYQSPWGGPEGYTSFMVPRSPRALFGRQEGLETAKILDPWNETIALLCVEDSRMAPWTEPVDFKLRIGGNIGLFATQQGGFLAAFADGQVSWLSLAVGRDKFPPFFTATVGDKLPAQAAQPSDKALEVFVRLTKLGQEEIPEVPKGTFFPEIDSAPAISASASSVPGEPKEGEGDNRAVIPSAEEINLSKKDLAAAFKALVEENKRKYPDPKMFTKWFAEEMMNNLEKVQADPTASYVLLTTVREKAMTIGNYHLAKQACEELTKRYQVNTFELNVKTLTDCIDDLVVFYRDQVPIASEDSEKLLREALQSDNYAAAGQLVEVYTRFAKLGSGNGTGASAGGPASKGRPNNNRGPSASIVRAKEIEAEVDRRSAAYKNVPESLDKLKTTPDDPGANLIVGKYRCLVKFQFQEGLKYLSKGSDTVLKLIAQADAENPSDPKAMAELAKLYYDRADRESQVFKRGLYIRASYWYQKAMAGLPANAQKLEAERNIAEVNRLYTDEFVLKAIDEMNGKKIE